MTTTVGVLHPGQMGAAVAAQARLGGAQVLWCPDGRSAATADRAAASLESADLRDLLRRSDIVLSICPPASAEELARAVAAHRFEGIFVEANAISPKRFACIRKAMTDAGVRVVDGSIIGGPPTEPGTRLYLAGASGDVSVVQALFDGTHLETVALDGEPGTASALKMAYGGYQKASRALAAVAQALAAQYGVADHLRDEGQRITRSPLAGTGHLPSVAARAWRWAPEMLEVADSLGDVGLPPHLSLGAAEVLARWNGDKDDWDITAEDALAHLREEEPLRAGRHAAAGD